MTDPFTRPTPPAAWPIAGTVTQPTPLLVELDRRPGAPVGPCQYEPRLLPIATAEGHTHLADAGSPPRGTRCLVTFADGDHNQPWVIAFTGWPTGGA